MKSIVCRDLGGRKLLTPAKGVSLKTVTYTDGHTMTVKVMR